jgi:hypothetical protein
MLSAMAEELGKIEKPPVADFKQGRKLYFVPLIVSTGETSSEFEEKSERYWEQVESQISSLELKLGNVNRIFHELVPESGEKAVQQLKDLKINSLRIVQSRMEKGALFEITEDNDILSELMDWSRCLSLGLQSQKVFSKIFESYNEVLARRSEFISHKIDETLKENETAILIMGEGHKVKFAQDIKLFYIAPPALDELKRWLRDYEGRTKDTPTEKTDCKDECLKKEDIP